MGYQINIEVEPCRKLSYVVMLCLNVRNVRNDPIPLRSKDASEVVFFGRIKGPVGLNNLNILGLM